MYQFLKTQVWAMAESKFDTDQWVFKQNPIFAQVLGMCPTLATTTSAENGLGMEATTAVLVMSNITISWCGNSFQTRSEYLRISL